MRGNRSLVIIAVVLIVLALGAGAVYVYLNMLGPAEPTEAELTPPVEIPETTEVVVALQNIPRGMQVSVSDNAIALQDWPNENLPHAYYTSLEEVDGKFARMEIPRGMPVMPDMVGGPGGGLAANGSAAALFEPEDRVAYAIPFDIQGAVGWAIEPGDRVDVLAALNMMPVYTDFLEEGIKQFTYLLSGEEGEVSQSSPYGEFELLPNGQWAAIYPIDSQPAMDPALLVQMTVQDAIVWHVGTWKQEVVEGESAASTADVDSDEAPLGGAAAAPTPIPEVVEEREIELVTLLVTREDALVLKYLHELGADLDLALRPAGVTGTVLQTQPIWFRYILDRYQLPDRMPDDRVAPLPIHPPLEVLPEPVEVPEE
jgi:hypothetical protein